MLAVLTSGGLRFNAAGGATRRDGVFDVVFAVLLGVMFGGAAKEAPTAALDALGALGTFTKARCAASSRSFC